VWDETELQKKTTYFLTLSIFFNSLKKTCGYGCVAKIIPILGQKRQGKLTTTSNHVLNHPILQMRVICRSIWEVSGEYSGNFQKDP
jgi:hypothetical protein